MRALSATVHIPFVSFESIGTVVNDLMIVIIVGEIVTTSSIGCISV